MKRKILLSFVLVLFTMALHGQKYEVNLIKELSSTEGCIRVTRIENHSDFAIKVTFRNKKDNRNLQRELTVGESTDVDITCTSVDAQKLDNKIGGGSNPVWTEAQTKKMWEDKNTEKESVRQKEVPDEVKDKERAAESAGIIKIETPTLPKVRKNLKSEEIVKQFEEYLNQIPFLSEAGVAASKAQVDDYVRDLKNWSNIDSCIAENNLLKYVAQNRDSLETYKSEAQTIAYGFSKQFDADEATNAEITDIINDRIEQRQGDLDRLEKAMIVETPEKGFSLGNINKETVIGIAIVALVILLLIVWVVEANKKKGKKQPTQRLQNQGAAPGIVVRRTTTSILKEQSLEDVMDNPAYLKVDCEEFCTDSAVRRIYLKNTCVKDIYNMYAEDLRNPNNPKEDGCMVLGRWVCDKDTNEYYVSLEHIVRPGDDAVFSEYELNFGGKIKLRVAEKLRKLRRETNLQYDMTCWVHSHPGLGVFFSNSDNNVQMQLKHPTHPLFLTAIVVDILTPEQELGIFTFKKDGTVNAKADLTKLYSLENLYKWAVESDRNTFKAGDYCNSLAKARKHYYDCAEVQLSNGAIIDMGMLATEQETGTIGFVHGFGETQGAKTRYVAATTSKQDVVPDNDLIGCFLTATHCSIPSIRKAAANHLNRINFVIVSSTTDGLLTTIPVINGELCGDTNYYGEENFEELKIWTRRKR